MPCGDRRKVRAGPRAAPRAAAAAASLLLAILPATACGGGSGETRDAADAASFGPPQTVVGGLETPWAIAFAGERTLLVTERAGRVRVVERGRLRARPAAVLRVAAIGEAGLLGLALDPDFPRVRFVYAYATLPSGNRVSRFRVTDDLRLQDEQVLLDGIPAAEIHDGGRIGFGPDGMLYVATGDAGNPALAADRGSLAGKILRIRPDGTVPADNPFGSPVWSYGHRNPQGLAWDSHGRLYEAEHGPTGEFGLCCHDEVNLVEKGRFYGWPFFAARTRAQPGEPPARPVSPLATSGEDTWAPSGIAVVERAGRPPNLLVATLAGERLLRIVLSGPRTVARTEVALDGFGRLRAAAVGRDHCLYVTTSNRDGRGSPRAGDDRVLRLCRRR